MRYCRKIEFLRSFGKNLSGDFRVADARHSLVDVFKAEQLLEYKATYQIGDVRPSRVRRPIIICVREINTVHLAWYEYKYGIQIKRMLLAGMAALQLITRSSN